MLQHGSYTLLIDACYDREHFPTLEDAYEWTWASTNEEKEAVAFVLHKFFTLENGVYVQKRIQEEIEDFHSKAETNKRIALERETSRKANNTNRARTVNEPPPNHKPITNNQEPNKRNTSAIAPPEGVSLSVWDDFKKLRKSKKSALTETALTGIVREANKAGWTLEAALRECCERGWTSFKSEWVADKTTGSNGNGETPYQRSMREKMQSAVPGIAAKAPGQKSFIDVEATNVTSLVLGG